MDVQRISHVEMIKTGDGTAQLQRALQSPRHCVIVNGVDSQSVRSALLRSRRCTLGASQVWAPDQFCVAGADLVQPGGDGQWSAPTRYLSLYTPDTAPTGFVCLAVGLALEQVAIDFLRPRPEFHWYDQPLPNRLAMAESLFNALLKANEALKKHHHRRLAPFTFADAVLCAKQLLNAPHPRFPAVHQAPQLCLMKRQNERALPYRFHYKQGCAVVEGSDPETIRASLTSGRLLPLEDDQILILTQFLAVGNPMQPGALSGTIHASLPVMNDLIKDLLSMRWVQTEVEIFARFRETPQQWHNIRNDNANEQLPFFVAKAIHRHHQDLMDYAHQMQPV